MRRAAGDVVLGELDGPFVRLELTGAFWHKRATVLRNAATYLTLRIPELVEVPRHLARVHSTHCQPHAPSSFTARTFFFPVGAARLRSQQHEVLLLQVVHEEAHNRALRG